MNEINNSKFESLVEFLQRSMCNLYKKTAPEVTNGEANFEICPIAFYFTLFGNHIV